MTVPPRPLSPIIDLTTGRLTPEWERWFAEIERLLRAI